MTKRQPNPPPATDETPPGAIPPGVKAGVTIKYDTTVDPNQSDQRRRDLEDLANLAGDIETEALPLDELSAFCQEWAQYAGYPLSIMRLADPPERRMPGQAYARPCFNMERIGSTTFEPASLIDTLRFINGNSGGVFRIWLTDYDGITMIPGAHVQRVALSDPPRGQTGAPPAAALPQQQFQPQQPPPQKSESERKLEETKDRLFNTALERALSPQQQQQVTPPPLPPEQAATLFLLGNSDFMPNIFKQMADLASKTAGVDKEPSLRDRALDAGVEIFKSNPAMMERVGNIVERIVARILPDPKLDGPPQQYFQQPPSSYAPPATQYTVTPNYEPQASNVSPGLTPEYPDADDDLGPDEDEEIMDIIDELTKLLNSDKPLTVSDPVFQDLRTRYPQKFKLAIHMIATTSLEDIIDWIKTTGGPLYVSLLDGPASGPYLRQRLGELQQLIIEAKNNASKAQRQTATESAPQTGSAPPSED